MKKNGFTLIELLAVIVILAIIALIATPIILGIINDAREESNERSVELYASAIRNGIAAHQLRTGSEVTAGSYTTDTLPMEVEYEGDVECSTINIYEDGGVYVANCKVNGDAIYYTYGEKQGSLIEVGKMNSVCTPVSTSSTGNVPSGSYDIGDEYLCKVDPNKDPYIFFVLSKDENNVNLIMESNIRTSGEAVKEEEPSDQQKGLVAWNEGDSTELGPISAMNYLESATKSWTNLNLITTNKYFSCNYEATTCDVTVDMEEYKTYARLPYPSEVQNYSETNKFLYNYLGTDTKDDESIPTGILNEVINVNGYWLLSAFNEDPIPAHGVIVWGNILLMSGSDLSYGVRPVITLDI